MTFRDRFLKKRVLFLVVNSKGEILEQNYDHPDFDNNNLFKVHPFFESIPFIVNEQNNEQLFPCIQMEIGKEKRLIDIEVAKEGDHFYINLFDFTEHYQISQTLAQDRNESIIKNELLQIQKDKISLEKELIQLKHESLKKAKKFKDEFLANMSHEIRTPLSAILGFSKLLENFDNTEEQKRFIEAISISGRNLNIIINDILDLSKIEAGKLKISHLDFNFNELIKNLHETYKLRTRNNENRLKFKVEVAPSIPVCLKGDAIRLNQILTNLLENAFKFTFQGMIALTVSVLDKTNSHLILNFMVKDQGIGIRKEKLDTIFDSFSQAHDNNKKDFGGTGLGLAIIKNLVNLMNGTIDVDSQYTKGTTFSVTIPFEISKKEDQQPVKAFKLEANQGVKKLKILVAEDVKLNQLLINKVLTRVGYNVTIVKNGQEALDVLNISPFDLLLLDLKMPVLDGYETTKQIRANKKSAIKNLPIIILTAHAFGKEREKCLQLGVNDYITKPIDLKRLLTSIENIFKD